MYETGTRIKIKEDFDTDQYEAETGYQLGTRASGLIIHIEIRPEEDSRTQPLYTIRLDEPITWAGKRNHQPIYDTVYEIHLLAEDFDAETHENM